MLPVIGITMNEKAAYGADLRQQYYKMLAAAGALPLALPPLPPQLAAPLLERLDGLLLSGGGDIEPRHFDESPLPGLGEPEPQRDVWELALIGEAWRRQTPMLGICRGMQALNVALGGDLWQDTGYMPGPLLPHKQEEPLAQPTHEVKLISPALISLLGAESIMVNSSHHQMLHHLAPKLQLAALSADGVAEAVVAAPPYAGFCLGLQWHPERLENEDSRRIFAAFVEAASGELSVHGF